MVWEMSTPRTDAAYRAHGYDGHITVLGLCRQLETELSAAEKARDFEHCRADTNEYKLDMASAERDALKAELAEANKRLSYVDKLPELNEAKASAEVVVGIRNGDLKRALAGFDAYKTHAFRLGERAEQAEAESAALREALYRINTVAVALPTFQVIHEGGEEAVVKNIIEAIDKARRA
jgi:chromosome segregation ATPase